jgi:hypothetical protein
MNIYNFKSEDTEIFIFIKDRYIEDFPLSFLNAYLSRDEILKLKNKESKLKRIV